MLIALITNKPKPPTSRQMSLFDSVVVVHIDKKPIAMITQPIP